MANDFNSFSRPSFTTALLVCFGICACSTPLPPYISPASGVPTANLRIITNATVSGQEYSGCIGERKLMAEATVQSSRKTPLTPARIEQMPPRISPKLTDVGGRVHPYSWRFYEAVTEQRVPAGIPFVIELTNVFDGFGGGGGYICPDVRRMFVFEENKNYEAYMGINKTKISDDKKAMTCHYAVVELLSVGKLERPLPRLVYGIEVANNRCAKQQK